MDAIKAILTRRSIRKFKNQPVPPALISTILECGLNAPSSKNAQPWRFHVINNKVTLDQIANTVLTNPSTQSSGPIDPKTGKPNERYKPTVIESAKVLQQAPVAIFIENVSPFMGGLENVISTPHIETVLYGYVFEIIGIGSAIENILIAAHNLGLGAVFMGDFVLEEKRIKELLKIKGDFLGIIAIGYSDQKKLWDKTLEKGRVKYY